MIGETSAERRFQQVGDVKSLPINGSIPPSSLALRQFNLSLVSYYRTINVQYYFFVASAS